MRTKAKWLFFGLFFLLMTTAIFISYNVSLSSTTDAVVQKTTVLIDAGHGGEDGGASAADGTLEKGINLAIANDLRDILAVFGVPVQMTRETDTAIYDAGCTTIRQKKVSDMVNRLRQYNAASMTVSIHQNHFSVAKYSGAQVFYSPAHPFGRTLATSVREKIMLITQPQNARELKMATDSIYLLHNTTKPAILVECGFLSNPVESEKLKSSAYQQQMAFAIAAGVLDVYCNEE